MHAPRPSPSPLQAHLAALHGQPLDTVLHVGAGQGAVLHAYAERPPRRLLLVEGDPASAEALRGAARGRPWVEVVEAVVAPDAGTVSWQAYNLARFNGPPVIDGLEAVYPRLHRAGQSNVHATALPSMSLFQAPQKPPASGHRDLLVLDVPGQGAALLASLEPELVQRFHWVLVRACTLVDEDGAAAWQASRTTPMAPVRSSVAPVRMSRQML